MGRIRRADVAGREGRRNACLARGGQRLLRGLGVDVDDSKRRRAIFDRHARDQGTQTGAAANDYD